MGFADDADGAVKKATNWPLMVAAVIYLAAYALPVLDPNLPTWLFDLCRWLSWITWGLFAVDLLVGLALADKRLRYLGRHWYDLLVIVLPLLRPLRLYYVRNPGDQSTPKLVATHGSTVVWSKPVDAGASTRPAVGANGQLYVLDGNSLRGLDADDGHDLFTPLALSEFQSGSYDRLFAYDKGLVIYSGFGKILYVDYAGHVTGGPYTYSVDPDRIFERDTAASATGDLFITWYDQALTPDGCLDADSNTHLAKFCPAGLEWTKPLPYVSR